MTAIEFLEEEIGDCHYNPNIDNEILAELLDKYAEQRAETASAVDTIVKRTNKDEEITIYRWQLEDVENVLRLTANIFGARDKDSCYGRDFRQSEKFVKNALNGEKDKKVKRI